MKDKERKETEAALKDYERKDRKTRDKEDYEQKKAKNKKRILQVYKCRTKEREEKEVLTL